MRKKFLIAADASMYSRKAMEYAARLSEAVKAVDFSLLHIQPMISQYLAEEAGRLPKVKKELEKVKEKNNQASRELLEECKSFLVSRGIDTGCIALESHARDRGIAEDILKIAEDRSFDAVIVGRRGLSGLQELFMGSVTTNLLNRSRVIPVWVVGGPFKPDNILVAVDGSSQSLRVVDHLAYIFSGNPDLRLTFLNIEPLLKDVCEIDLGAAETAELEAALLDANKKCISGFAAQAGAMLQKAGFESDRVSFDSLKKQLFTGKAICDYARKGDFSTVVIGKTGAGGSSDLGKVARYIIQKISDRTVWVIP
jgi:nucleotide-binding universal stress UspA family protein